MSAIGRPMSPGIRLSSFSASGVKRRMRRSGPTMTIGICTLPSRLTRSLLSRFSSTLRLLSSSLTVASSSLLDWISSFEVSSSSLMLCSSSLADCTSSFADCSSSLAASCCSITDCRYSRVAASSCASRALSRSASAGGSAGAAALSSDGGAPSLDAGCWRPGSSNSTRKPPSLPSPSLPSPPDRHHLDGDLAPAAVGLDAQALLARRLARSCRRARAPRARRPAALRAASSAGRGSPCPAPARGTGRCRRGTAGCRARPRRARSAARSGRAAAGRPRGAAPAPASPAAPRTGDEGGARRRAVLQRKARAVRRTGLARVDLLLGVHRLEQVAEAADRLGRAEPQDSPCGLSA